MQAQTTISWLGARLLHLGPAVILTLVWLLAAYRAGGYMPQTWLPLAVAVGFFGLVMATLRAYARPPSRLLLLILGLFTLYVLWMALSVTWAMGPGPAWQEATRAGFYLVFFASAVTYLAGACAQTDTPTHTEARTGAIAQTEGGLLEPGARTAGRALLLAAGLVIVIVALARFASPVESDFFLARRLGFPLTYPNGAGSFYLLLIWPLLWLAADPRGRLWMRALSLGTLTALLQLGVLTQSRGAAAALVISAALYFILTPARVRSLVFLVAPSVLLALAFDSLTSYYVTGAATVDRTAAISWLAGSFVAAGFVGLVLSLADRRLRFPYRVRAVIAALVIALVVLGAVFGFLQLQSRVGDVSEWASGLVSTFLEDTGGEEAGIGESRFGDVTGNGRGPMWRTAWEGFLGSPIIGNGVASYRYLNDLHRPAPTMTGQQAHSLEFDILDETGIVGMVLFVATFGTALGIVLAPRFRSWWALLRRRRRLLLRATDAPASGQASPGRQAWIAALTGALLFWFIHASADWIWHFPGVTLGAFLLLAYALSAAVPYRRYSNDTGGATENVAATQQSSDSRLLKYDTSPVTASRRERRDLPFRLILGVMSLAVLLGAGLPYLSMQYENLALSRMRSDTEAALGHASTAQALFPVSSEPLRIRTEVYRAAAQSAAALSDPDVAARGVLEALSLALATAERAIEKECAWYRVHYDAGLAALDLLAARDGDRVYGERAAGWAGRGATWSDDGRPQAAGDGNNQVLTLAGESERLAATAIMATSDDDLLARATAHLEAARARNPLGSDVQRAVKTLETAPTGG
jgi:hypothetical protein